MTEPTDLVTTETRKPRKRRAYTLKNVLDRKPKKTLNLQSDLGNLLGNDVEPVGFWLVYGNDKNGKTSVTLELADVIAQSEKVVYISAEEGIKGTFQAALRRSNLTAACKNILIEEYMSIEDIIETYKSPRKAGIIIIDNLTSYEDEFREDKKLLNKLKTEMANKLIIFLAHEDNNKPAPSVAVKVRKWADVILHTTGLLCDVKSRYIDGGGEYIIHDSAEQYHGSQIFTI